MPKNHIVPFSGDTQHRDEEQVLYELGPITRLPREIVNKDDRGRGGPLGDRRWTSRLALEHARTVAELLLEAEAEWRLYEELRALGLPFKLSAQRPRLQREEDLQGRVRFVLDDARTVTWTGAAGFVLRDSLGDNVAAATVPAVLAALQA